MYFIGGLVLGLIIGFFVGFFVYRNNQKRFNEKEAQLETKYAELLAATKDASEDVKKAVDGIRNVIKDED